MKQSFTTRRSATAGYVAGNRAEGSVRSGGRKSFGGYSSNFGSFSEGRSWGRNQNTVRHLPKTLGKFSHMAIVGMLVLVVGLIYVAQGTKTSNYDYELSGIDQEIAELTAKKEELVVEQARLTSIAKSEGAEVAKVMQEGKIAGYVEE